jgi:hypothetical protein
LSISAHLWGQTEDAICVFIKASSLLKRQELKVDAALSWVDAGLVLGLLSSKFGGAIQNRLGII